MSLETWVGVVLGLESTRLRTQDPRPWTQYPNVADSDRLRIAVFIDFDNIEIGVKNTLNAAFDAGLVLEALKERGEVVSKTAYSDWQRAGSYSRMLTQHAIKMVQRNLTPGGDKNGADINLALDALEMAFTHPHINAFVIVGGDSDFISLVEKLKQYDKKVFVVGGRQFTSVIMQRNCHEFIAYENLGGAARAGRRWRSAPSSGRDRAPIEQVIPLVTRALKVLSEREVSPQLGLLKSTLLQLDSTFSERTTAPDRSATSSRSSRRWASSRCTGQGRTARRARGRQRHPRREAGCRRDRRGTIEAPGANGNGHRAADESQPSPSQGRTVVIGTAAEGLREFRRILSNAVVRRWPLYLRNVKQAIRQTEASFDERSYGFGNLTDLLRAAHREGIVRVDRDRQGVIRVFQGSTTATPSTPGSAEASPDVASEETAVAAAAAELGVPLISLDEDPADTGSDTAEIEPGNAAPAVEAPRKRRQRAPRGQSTRPRRSTKKTA